jgi:VCBS repeat-containing protein
MKTPVLCLRSLSRAAFLVVVATALALALALASGPGPNQLGRLQRTATLRQSQGYWLLGADGGVFSFGDAGSFGPHRNRDSDIAGLARTRDGGGLWVVDDDGDVFHYGNAINHGSRLLDTNDIAGFAARPQGDGYWMASQGGSVWAFGAAGHRGPAVVSALNRPIVDMAATPSGQGYWLVASDGGVFSYGDAGFYGSTGAIVLNRPVVGMAATPSGRGYWLVASDGGVFSFGDAAFYGSTGGMTLNKPVVAMASTGTGRGYWLVASDGGVFSFGDAGFFGSTGGITLDKPIVAMVPTPLRLISVLPSAAADAASAEEDSAVSVDVLANDSGLDDGGIAVTVIDGPDHGSATVAEDGRITYSPRANYAGADAVVYQVRDVDGDLASAALTITVTERNDAPVAPDRSRSTDEDVPLSGLVGASDVDGDQLRYEVTGAAAHGTAVVDASGAFTYSPARDYNGADSFTVTVSDGRGASDSAVTQVTVNPVNDAPTIGALADATTDEDTATAVGFIVDDVDTPLASLVVSATSSNPAVLGDSGITPGGAAGARSLVLAPAAEASGDTTVTVTVGDGSATATGAFLLSVEPVDDAPAAAGDTAVTDEEVAVGIDVLANDSGLGDGGAIVTVDGDTLDPATEGTASVTGGTITFTPAPDVCWTVTFTYTVTDIDGDASTGTVTVTVNPINDPPVILPSIADVTVTAGDPIAPILFTVTDADPADETLQVTVHTEDNPTLLTDANLTLVGTGSDWSLTVVPAPLEVGQATITVSVFDGTTTTDETFVLTVEPPVVTP